MVTNIFRASQRLVVCCEDGVKSPQLVLLEGLVNASKTALSPIAQ
jgi:hypothetical protein